MTKEQEVIISLIRTAVTGKVEALPAGVDWSKVIDFAMQQGVLGLCFEAVELLSSDQRPDMDNLMSWLGHVEYMKTCYEEHKMAISELAEFYANCGSSGSSSSSGLSDPSTCSGEPIKMMLLKGYGLSLYWPTPEHRPVGDIDIYLGHLWQFADQMVHDKLGIEIDKDHHHHTCFSYNGVMVENHYDFINVHAHRDAPLIEAKLKKLASIGFREFQVSDGSKVVFPSADFNALFLLRHMGQHFAGERVTLRQLLDWWFFVQAETCGSNGSKEQSSGSRGSRVNWAETDAFLMEIGLYDFKVMVNHICEYICEDASVVLSPIEKRILNDVLEPEFTDCCSGVWFRLKRWMANRWKHRLLYNENLITMFFTLAMSHVRGPKV